MKLGQLTDIQVEDVTFYVDFSWGDAKALRKKADNLDEEDIDAAEELMEAAINDHVVRAEGLEDADGVEVEKWKPEYLDQLPMAIVGELFAELLDVGEAMSGNAQTAGS